jgi:hypothetical protein
VAPRRSRDDLWALAGYHNEAIGSLLAARDVGQMSRRGVLEVLARLERHRLELGGCVVALVERYKGGGS